MATAATVTLLERRLGLEVEMDAPPDFSETDRLVPLLGYPAELGGVANVKLDQSDMSSVPTSFPLVNQLADGVLVWVTGGDYAFDREAPALTGPPPDLSVAEIRARTATEVPFIPPLTSGDQSAVNPYWPNAYMWYRNIPVSKAHYCNLYVFAGNAAQYIETEQPPQAAVDIVASLRIRDYT